MRTPRMYFHSRFSTSARVSALIIPRSATMQTEPIPNRFFNRSTMGTRLFTSAVLPGHSSVQSGLPLWSSTMPTTICFRSERADSEPLLQPFHDGNQALHIRRIARPQFGAERIAVVVQHHAYYHLLQVGTMVFGVAVLAESLASFALEVDRRRIEKHDVQIGEKLATPRAQRLFNEVLVGTGSERRGPVLLGFRKNFSQPGHGPVELVQVQIADSFDGVVVLPLLGGTVATRREEAMQHGEEDGTLDGKLEAPILEQGRQDFVDGACLPEPLE